MRTVTAAIAFACLAAVAHAAPQPAPRLVNAQEPTKAQRDSILNSLPAQVRTPVQMMERGGLDQRTFARAARARARLAAGETDSGLVALRTLADENPTDVQLCHMYVDALLQNGRAQEAASFLGDRLSDAKMDAWDLRGQLARAQFLSGHKADADKTWDAMLALRPKLEITYREVAGQRLSVRDFEGAEQTYAAGRRALGQPAAFAADLENLHKASNRLDAAMDDCMQMLRQNGAVDGWVGEELVSLAKMSTQPGSGGSRSGAVTAELLTLARTLPDQLPLRTVALRVLLVQNRGETAVAFATQLDRDTRRTADLPSALIMLAQLAQESGDSTTARNAARQGMSVVLKPADAVAARWILAREADAQGRVDDAVTLYRQVVALADSVRAHDDGASALSRSTVIGALNDAPLRVGALELRRGRPDAAIAAYEQVIAAPTSGKVGQVEAARVALADCYLAVGRLEEAKGQYEKIAKSSPSRTAREHAAFGLGEAAFFGGNYKDAAEQYRALTDVFPEGASVNDALQRILLIAECQPDGAGLARYATAERQIRAARFDSAVVVLRALAAGDTLSPVTPLAALRIGDVLLAQQRAAEAAAAYAAVVDNFPQSRQAPDALRAQAAIYAERLGQPSKALDLYTRFLLAYPTNVFVSDVRAKAEKLRRPAGKAS